MLDAPHVAVRRSDLAAGPLLLAGFAAALFASAFLLFSVQPVVSRLILPRLGGSPGVWNTCVCFFQMTLLLGYGYAHLVATHLRVRAQVLVHAGLLGAGMAALPLSVGDAAPPFDASPVPWLLWVLASRVGLPFLAISATAPLLQGWFARTTHPQARDPYFLYAASNAGSLVALLGYPVLIETTLGLSEQGRLWSLGFVVTAALVLLSGMAALLRGAAPAPVLGSASVPLPRPGLPMAERLRWVALSFVPSALMLAVTTHITADVVAVPLFWMLPLAIYILTFIVAFGRRAPAASPAALRIQGVTLALAGLTGLLGTGTNAAMLLPLAAFTLAAVVCHTELAARRPGVAHLTGYFLLISLGGALGGVFNALLAPVLFPLPLEYPLLLVAACLLRPAPARTSGAARLGDVALPAVLALSIVALMALDGPGAPHAAALALRVGTLLLCGAGLLWSTGRRVRLALGLAACLFVPMAAQAVHTKAIVRNFFGILRVQGMEAEDVVTLQHGSTVHGVQGLRAGEELAPYGYYSSHGPFGRLFATLAQPTPSVGVLGLGVGSLACYARPGEAWTFYEINPAVAALARDTRWFHHLSGCGNQPAVVLGDARLQLAAEPARRFDVLVVDVFSSDSIPVHLLTKEAMALYLSHLNPGGTLLVHVSNRYLDLVPVVARLATDAGANVRHLLAAPGGDAMRGMPAEVVAVGAPGNALDALAADGWDVPAPGPVLWTDERSDVLGVIRWR